MAQDLLRGGCKTGELDINAEEPGCLVNLSWAMDFTITLCGVPMVGVQRAGQFRTTALLMRLPPYV